MTITIRGRAPGSVPVAVAMDVTLGETATFTLLSDILDLSDQFIKDWPSERAATV